MTCQVLDGEIGKTTLCVGAADRKCRGGESSLSDGRVRRFKQKRLNTMTGRAWDLIEIYFIDFM